MSGVDPWMPDIAQQSSVKGPTTAAWLLAWGRRGRLRDVALPGQEPAPGFGRSPRRRPDRHEFANVALARSSRRDCACPAPALAARFAALEANSEEFAFVALPSSLGMPLVEAARWSCPWNPVVPGGGKRSTSDFVLLRSKAKSGIRLSLGRPARMAVLSRGSARPTWQLKAVPGAESVPWCSEGPNRRARRSRVPDRR